jgi:carboxymethylenebutenolidase
MEAFLARPDAEARHPGIIVIHEIFGLNDNIRGIAQRFAAEGYTALAVDLFSNANRVACLARIMAGVLISPLRNGVVGELRAAVAALQARQDVDATRVGVIGFCMGGTYALQLACVDDTVRVASLLYGLNPRPLQAVARACPIVASYPDRDFTTADGRKLEAALAQFDVPHDVKIYPGTRHSFFNNQGRTYNSAAADDSWARTLAFFERYLK